MGSIPDDAVDTRSTELIKYVNEPYTFEKVTNPSVWKTYNSLEEMLGACQLPIEMMNVMSTENLIQTFMNHPLYFIYSAYNNEMDGVKVILDNFNGFKELQKREDVAEKILDYYEAMDVSKLIETVKNFKSLRDKTIYHLDFLEMVIATKEIPNLFSSLYRDRLEEIMNDKYEAKLSSVNANIFSVRKSLILGSEIKLSKHLLSEEDKYMLEQFARTGGRVPDEQYTKISEIIYLK